MGLPVLAPTTRPFERARQDRAIRCLKVNPKSVSDVPSITAELKFLDDIEHPDGVHRDVFYYLGVSDDPEAHAILAKYYSVKPKYREYLPIEACCIAAGVSPFRVLTIVQVSINQLVIFRNRLAVMKAVKSQSQVIAAAIASASVPIPEANPDRQLVAKITGLIPTPHGPKTTVNVSAAAQINNNEAPKAPPEATIRRLTNRFNESPPRAEVIQDVQPEES
jgi:hypothetical protein